MVRWLCLLALVLLTMLSGWGRGAAETLMPEFLLPATENLVLNGQGTRTKLFLTLYEAGLYLREKSTDAVSIVAADQPMAIRLVVESSLITSEKMEQAVLEGFAKSTGGRTAVLHKEIDAFIEVFRDEIKENDVYEMIYFPARGVQVMKNNVTAVSIPGLPFKQALFGIWLGPDPVQESLKKGLLGEIR